MKVVILAGGLGTRLSEETELKPKPLVEIGGGAHRDHVAAHEFALHLGDADRQQARAVRAQLAHRALVDEHGAAQFVLPGILKVPPLTGFGNPSEIARRFGGADKLRDAVNEMSGLLYAA